MSDLFTAFGETLTSQLLGKTLTTASRWAEKRRIMGPPHEGPYSFQYFPWARGLHDSTARWNVSMKSAQAGFTEVGINLALYTIDQLRRNVLYVLPTAGNASDFAKSRFDSALRLSPYLKSVFTEANNVGLKMAGNTSLFIRGSRGDSNLKSIPASLLILDEMDEMDQTQIELALQRLRGQVDTQVWFISTPTTPNHGVALEYEKSTQESFMFKCPSCDKLDQFAFPGSLEICGSDMNDPACYKSFYKCQHCAYRYKSEVKDNFVYQYEKLHTLQNGVWTPTITGTDPDRRGFKINQLYSYTVSPGQVAIDYFKSQLNPYAKQEFHKSVLGEPFIDQQSNVSDALLLDACRDYQCRELIPRPKENRLIVLGIDRGQWCNYVVAEYFIDPSALDLNNSARCRVLDAGRFHEEDFETIPDRLMREWQVKACMVDADPGPQEARKFARRFPGFVWLNRYRSGKSGKEMTIEDDGSYAPLATVDRTNWLDVTLGRFYSNRIELPNDLPRGFAEDIKNLVRIYEQDANNNPIAVYRNFGKPDHYAHALNYAEMALPCAMSVMTNQNIGKFL